MEVRAPYQNSENDIVCSVEPEEFLKSKRAIHWNLK
jgi:hypothetical protein